MKANHFILGAVCSVFAYAAPGSSAIAQTAGDPVAGYQPGPAQGVEVIVEYIPQQGDKPVETPKETDRTESEPAPVQSSLAIPAPYTVVAEAPQAGIAEPAATSSTSTAMAPTEPPPSLAKFATRTDASGTFVVPNLAKGMYIVRLRIGERTPEEQITLESQMNSPIRTDVRHRAKMRRMPVNTTETVDGPGYRIFLEGVQDGVFTEKVSITALNKGVQYTVTITGNQLSGKIFGE